MKNITRFLALLLAGALTFALVGCGDAPVETTTEPISTTTAVTTTAETTTAETTTVATEVTTETTTETTTEATTTTEETTTEETTTEAPKPAISAEDITNHAELPLWGETTAPHMIERPNRPSMTPTIVPYVVEGADTAVIIYPGGGYYQLSWDSEGKEIAKAYNEKGISAFIVRYRYYPYAAGDGILADGQRAVQFVRYYAEDFGIDPEKIAVCGFSAGGHLAMAVAQHAPEENLIGDAIGEVSAAPNACILCYPVTTFEPGTSSGSTPLNFLGKDNVNNADLIAKYSYGYNLAAMPDTFIWYGEKDTTVDPAKNSVALANALVAIGTNVQCIAYSDAGHGVGLASTYNNASKWHAASVDFLAAAFAE